MCHEEVSYYLLPRYNVDDVLKDILRRRVINVDNLCELCMNSLNEEITEAVGNWKTKYGK